MEQRTYFSNFSLKFEVHWKKEFIENVSLGLIQRPLIVILHYKLLFVINVISDNNWQLMLSMWRHYGTSWGEPLIFCYWLFYHSLSHTHTHNPSPSFSFVRNEGIFRSFDGLTVFRGLYFGRPKNFISFLTYIVRHLRSYWSKASYSR